MRNDYRLACLERGDLRGEGMAELRAIVEALYTFQLGQVPRTYSATLMAALAHQQVGVERAASDTKDSAGSVERECDREEMLYEDPRV